MEEEDADALAKLAEIADIYDLYASGKISLEAAAKRVGNYLDSKGDLNAPFARLLVIKNWRR
jgi:20S proteasome alpha/beta subunit